MAATMAPTIGAVRYNQASLKLPVATIGPSARAGVEGGASEGSAHGDVEGQMRLTAGAIRLAPSNNMLVGGPTARRARRAMDVRNAI
jgi:hypothetical protein